MQHPQFLLHKRHLSEHLQKSLVKPLRDGPLENLWEGGGGRSTKKIFAQGKIK